MEEKNIYAFFYDVKTGVIQKLEYTVRKKRPGYYDGLTYYDCIEKDADFLWEETIFKSDMEKIKPVFLSKSSKKSYIPDEYKMYSFNGDIDNFKSELRKELNDSVKTYTETIKIMKNILSRIEKKGKK